MSQSPITVTYSLEEVLKQINQKLDKLDEKVYHLIVEMVTTKTKIEGMENDIKDIKGSQKAQIWTLIGIIITAVAGFLAAVARFVII